MNRESVTGFDMTRLDSPFAPLTILNERGELSKNAQRREWRIQAGPTAAHEEATHRLAIHEGSSSS